MSDSFDWVDDARDLNADAEGKKIRTPSEIQEHLLDVVYNRDVFAYWDSIPWDSEWLLIETPFERATRIREIEENAEAERHPFKRFI